MTTWKKICRIEDIPVLGARRVARDRGLDVAVFRNDADEVFALLDRCPHKGGPLSQGIVFGQQQFHEWRMNEARCALHVPPLNCAVFSAPFDLRV